MTRTDSAGTTAEAKTTTPNPQIAETAMGTDLSAGPATTPLLNVSGLTVMHKTPAHTSTVVSGVDLTIAAGEMIAVVGESGSGKSVTAKAIMGLLPQGLHASGTIAFDGKNLMDMGPRQRRAMRGNAIGMILQDPFTMLNPVMRVGRILVESLPPELARRPRAEKRQEAVRRLAEVGIDDPSVVDRYPFQLSGGMRQRVAIAAALACDPEILIADEPSTALDVTTQHEILSLIKELQRSRGMGVMLITHDLRLAFGTCDRVHVFYAGSLLEVAPSADLEHEPLHPYSHGLLLSEPPADRKLREMLSIPGSVPAPDDVADGCAFAPRCRWATDVCTESAPELVSVGGGRWSRCVRLADIRDEMVEIRSRVEAGVDELPTPDQTRDQLVQVRDVVKQFDNGKGGVRAVDGVSINIAAGQSVGIVGESGSGKTTLARMLIGLETASGGEIEIDGVSATDWSALSRRDARRLRGTVQMVFQDPYSSLNPMRTIGWTLQEAIRTHDPKAADMSAQVGDLLETVGLPASYAQRKPVALSGGERQRVAIGRALAARPQLLICDESVSALDMSVQAQILNLFGKLREERGIGYLFITHDLAIVRQVADYIYVMHRGRVVEHGPTGDVLDRPKAPYTRKLIDSVPRSDGWAS
ncbi:dipeptide ABC transporter ATP-binding protein [Streptomyces phaeochromogenes]|uniref:dipeptide ABC transporter ATP-binding protein n=1 Tax=Streptomyces phaeochromogenes TaxID=1923 RepID=UPI0038630511|nr:ABC transporter ATP-binding protein [Streptomyces phaeochromogenes]